MKRSNLFRHIYFLVSILVLIPISSLRAIKPITINSVTDKAFTDIFQEALGDKDSKDKILFAVGIDEVDFLCNRLLNQKNNLTKTK